MDRKRNSMSFLDRHLDKLVWAAGGAGLLLVLRHLQAQLPSDWSVHPCAYLGLFAALCAVAFKLCSDGDFDWDSSDGGDSSGD